MLFEELDISDELLDALDDMHITTCTPIQEKAIPLALQGRDLIAVAQTGTGKTAAYLLPVIDLITYGDYPQDAINCIVMAPTRELAQQIDRQMEGFGYYMPVSSIAVYGGGTGEEFGRQQRGLKNGADIVIATPGRLLAHLAGGAVDLSKVSFFILDEADRMLDMGFYDDIMQIVRHLPKERQTLMFSATMPPKIKKLARDILTDPAEVKIAVSRPAEKIEQSVAQCGEGQKPALMEHLLKTLRSQRVIVFASSKLKVKDLARTLRRRHIRVGEMHSDLEQKQRDEVMLDFKANRIDVLVATDIVARGIDIEDISMVVNYDVPRCAEDYVHRIGRTARANAGGIAVTLVSPADRSRFARIESFLKTTLNRLTLPETIASATPAAQPASRPAKAANNSPRRKSKPSQHKKATESPAETSARPTDTTPATPVNENSPKPRKPSGKRRYRRKPRPENPA
ncbi:MAG: DEAD/DEAH box helicase [Muribaculaceae bacterium]|nr:DEAD/DEAH box helicase [Muribaculaceae bacterium]